MRGFSYHSRVEDRGFRYFQRLLRQQDQESYCKTRDKVENRARGGLSGKGFSRREINKMLRPKWAANLKDDSSESAS